MQTYELESFYENGFSLEKIKELLCPEGDEDVELVPELILQALTQLYGIEIDETPGLLKIDKEKISIRVLHLIAKMGKYISYQEMLTTYMNESFGGEFLKEFTAEEIQTAIDFCSITVDGEFMKFVDVAKLDDNPKLRFDQLFELQSRWLGKDLEKFFKQITHKELSFAQLTIKYKKISIV